MKKLTYLLPVLLLFFSCSEELADEVIEPEEIVEPIIIEEYGYNLNDFEVIRDTIRNGDTFGAILNEHGVSQAKIFEVASTFRDSFDVRKIVVGKPYVLLNAKDTTNTTQVFIYEKNRVDYAVVDFRDSINIYNDHKPVTYVQKEASGIISSSLSQTMADSDLSPYMSEKLANIYAWTVNFFALQPGDNFKVIYTEKFINDTIPAGLDDIQAAYFEHRGRPLYAINFETDSLSDFYDEEASNLRRAFLKSPIRFNYRISSKYNLRRRIAHYGYRVRPHRGTDFAAPNGTPILATADGVVTKSSRNRGNGNYVKVKHNSTYATQYLHMSRRKSKVGDFVRQGEVIGYVGSTGSSSGNHVCYRFWKNGKEVDPFQQDLPASKPLDASYHESYFKHMEPLKDRLDCIEF